LPTEILGSILEMTYDIEQDQECSTEQGPNHAEHLLTLASVSSRFLSVVIDTATLWAVADWRCSPAQLKKCLERSRGALVAVKYNLPEEHTREQVRVSLRRLISEDFFGDLGRWRDADLFIDSGRMLVTLSKLAAPQLRRVVIKYFAPPTREPIHLFRGNAPNLRMIDLAGIHVHWEWSQDVIANLRSLVLSAVKISEASVLSFLSVIKLSSILQKLVIRLVSWGDTVDLPAIAPSRLNSLKEIVITG
ncbi:hypothetical protein FRC01_010937, partial [Tulasnella sp. 417]